MTTHSSFNSATLAYHIKNRAKMLGFADARITHAQLSAEHQQELHDWLAKNYHGSMAFLQERAALRCEPTLLVPNTLSIITVRMNYWPQSADAWDILQDGSKAYISRYALGRDYHKVMRHTLQELATWLESQIGEYGYRAFSDSAPVMEVALATQAGLGWRGKHTLLLTKEEGSLFFLGELFTTLPLPSDEPVSAHCGSCRRCLNACPTQAIIAPYTLDARRCISYLTIESKDPIPMEFRKSIGNRIYGCDDCQLVCPWNRFAPHTSQADFKVRHGLDDVSLLELWSWDKSQFKKRMAGSPIYRIGYERWRRNLAVALGNAPKNPWIVQALHHATEECPSDMLLEHIEWAIGEQNKDQR